MSPRQLEQEKIGNAAQTERLREYLADEILRSLDKTLGFSPREKLELLAALNICPWCGMRESEANSVHNACGPCEDMLGSCL